MDTKVKELFYQLKAESLNWTGYNADLVERVSKEGISLYDECERLYKDRESDFKEGIETWTPRILIAIIISIGLYFGISAIGNSSQYDTGYSQGLSDSVKTDKFIEFKSGDSYIYVWKDNWRGRTE